MSDINAAERRDTVPVALGDRSYDIHIGEGLLAKATIPPAVNQARARACPVEGVGWGRAQEPPALAACATRAPLPALHTP